MSGVKLGNDKTKINTGGKDRLKFEDLADLITFPNQDFKPLRPIGDIFAFGTHWFEVQGTKKDGTPYKGRSGRMCLNVKADGSIDPKGGCGFCKVGHSPRSSYVQNQIDVEEIENAPRNTGKPTPDEKKSGFRVKGSKFWNPTGVLIFPPSVAETMQKLTKKNKDKDGKVRELSDPVYGKALDISRDTRDGVSPANMWNVQKADEPMRKLTPEQREYYLWDIASVLAALMPTAKQSEADMKYNVVQFIEADFEKLDLKDYPELLAKRDGGKKKSKGGRFSADDEEDDEEDDLPKRKKRRVEEDEDEDDDLPRRSSKKRARDDEDEDEDEAPIRKKKKTTATKSKTKKRKSFNVDDVL